MLIFPHLPAGSGGSGGLKIVTFSTTSAKNDDIANQVMADMILAAQAGKINLQDYWSVGDERDITVNSYDAAGNADYYNRGGTHTIVLAHAGAYNTTQSDKYISNNGEVSFVAGFKTLMTYSRGSSVYPCYQKMNDTSSSIGSWRDSKARAFCNNEMFNALPQYFKDVILTVNVITGDYNGTDTGGENIITQDKVFYAGVKEVLGSLYSYWDGTYMKSTANEYEALTKFSYYEISANRKKTYSGTNDTWWWTRSPSYAYSGNFCYVPRSSDYTSYPLVKSANTTDISFVPHFCI